MPEWNVFADDYRKIDDTALVGYTIKAKAGLTLGECESKCNELGLACGLFHYRPSDGRCALKNVIYKQAQDADPDAIRNTTQFEMYTRHC